MTARFVPSRVTDLSDANTYPASVTHAASAKSTPSETDELALVDSNASWGLKKFTIANLRSLLANVLLPTPPGDSKQFLNGASTPAFAFPPSTELAVVEGTTSIVVSSSTESAGNVLLDLGALTFDGSPYLFEFTCPRVFMPIVAGDAVIVSLFEGGTVSGGVLSGGTQTGRLAIKTNPASHTWITEMEGEYRFSPSAGSHHYYVTANVSSTNNATFVGGTGGTGNELPMRTRVTTATAAGVASVPTSFPVVKRYAPNPLVVYDSGLTRLDPPPQRVDPSTSNLSVSFTLASSSNIVVRLEAWHDTLTQTYHHASQLWGVIENGSFLAGGLVDRTIDPYNWINTGTTTATGVNALNSATVNVADTSQFGYSGTFIMGGVSTTYTGKTATSFTGCGNHAATTGGEAITRDSLIGAGVFTSLPIYIPNVSAGDHTYHWGWSNGDNMRLIIGDGVTQDGAGHIWSPAYMTVSLVP